MSSSETPAPSKKKPRAAELTIAALAVVAIGGVVTAGVMLERSEQKANDTATAPSARAATSAPGSSAPAATDAAIDRAAILSRDALARACSNSNDCACRARVTNDLLIVAAAEAALKVLESEPAACRSTSESESLRCEALARMNAPGAHELARRRSLEDPSDGRAAYALARLAAAGGDKVAAKSAAGRAAELGRAAAAEALLGRIALDAGDHDQALVHLAKAIQLEPKEVEAHYYRGLALRRAGNYQKARSSLFVAVRENPGFVDARLQLAIMAHSIGALDDARHHYRKLVELMPSDDARLKDIGDKLGERRARGGSTYTVGRAASSAEGSPPP